MTAPPKRAMRKCRIKNPLPTQDSQDTPEDDDDTYDDDSDASIVAPSRKKKRTRSVSPLRDIPDEHDLDRTHLFSEEDLAESQRHLTIQLTVNVPFNHQGPINLVLDPQDCIMVPRRIASTAIPGMASVEARSKPATPKSNSFLGLPAEIRNVIYREVFVTKWLNFGKPGKSFSRTSALLRTCKQVHEEGRSILYSENTFKVERRWQQLGSLWSDEWREMGYLAVRIFMKSIGPANTALIRHVNFKLEDAIPALNPTMISPDERRFVHDDELMSILRHLVKYSELQTMKLHFNGRRQVERGDDRFLDYMRRIRADHVEFEETWKESKQEDSVTRLLLAACTRKHKRFD